MSVVDSLLGDSFAAVRSFGPDIRALRNLPWLELELVSGRSFELVPTSQMRGPIESLGIDLRQVESFRLVHKWPEGPSEPKIDLEALAPALGKQIAAAHFERTEGADETNCLSISVRGFGVLRFIHDLSLPESMVVEIGRYVPSNKSYMDSPRKWEQ